MSNQEAITGVDRAAQEDVNGAVWWAVFWDVNGAVWGAVDGATYWSVDDAVFRAVGGTVWDDPVLPAPPALQDFLLSSPARAGAEAG